MKALALSLNDTELILITVLILAMLVVLSFNRNS